MSMDRHWARQYVLDPLTAPEPSQETGPGSSHYHPLRYSVNQSSSSSSPEQDRSFKALHERRNKLVDPIKQRSGGDSPSQYPTPPSSTSPSRSDFHPSNPFSSSNKPSSPPEDLPPSYKLESSYFRNREPRCTPPHRQYPPNSYNNRLPPPPSQQRQIDSRRSSLSPNDISRLRQRFYGDMSHQPLEMLKKEHRAADRPRRPRQAQDTDIIDSLDTIGGTYHHGGPYDAALASRNMNKKYSPLAAVESTNSETIRATPREYIKDSLERHVPLQGVAVVPNGAPDFSGRVMNYEEGADLMREADAAGGAYKRWEGLIYHPDDLKGKSEPSYTLERDQQEKHRLLNGDEYEMQSGVNGDGILGPAPRLSRAGRQRSFSSGAHGSTGSAFGSHTSGVHRSNSTGKKLGQGLKKRFGSLRKKRDQPTEEAY